MPAQTFSFRIWGVSHDSHGAWPSLVCCGVVVRWAKSVWECGACLQC